jgi:hypothetical protein
MTRISRLALYALTACAAGCVVTVGKPGQDGSNSSPPASSAKTGDRFEPKGFPKTAALLAQAEAQLLAHDSAAATTTLARADETYVAERAALPKSESAGETFDRNGATMAATQRRAALSMMAWMAADNPLRAVGVAMKYDLACEWAPSSLKQECSSADEKLRAAYPDIWSRRSVTAVDCQARIDGTVDTVEMVGVEKRVNGKPGPYVACLYPERVAPDGGGVTRLAWQGHSTDWIRTECKKVGTLEAGSVSFDLERCNHIAEKTTPANVSVEIAAEDAALVKTWKKGDVIGLMLDSTKAKHAGNSWNLGAGRAFFVGKRVYRPLGGGE